MESYMSLRSNKTVCFFENQEKLLENHLLDVEL